MAWCNQKSLPPSEHSWPAGLNKLTIGRRDPLLSFPPASSPVLNYPEWRWALVVVGISDALSSNSGTEISLSRCLRPVYLERFAKVCHLKLFPLSPLLEQLWVGLFLAPALWGFFGPSTINSVPGHISFSASHFCREIILVANKRLFFSTCPHITSS